MGDVIIHSDLIEINLESQAKEEVLAALSRRLLRMGFVTEDFMAHVLEREEAFPTGLPTIIPLALCHTEARFVKQSALAAATLKQPVEFHEMGNPDDTVQAEIVFLLALNDPKDQVMWLKKLVTVFKNGTALRAIRDAPSAEALATVLRSHLFAATAERT